MEILIAKPKMELYLKDNISKYEITPKTKYIKTEYLHPKFNIKIYNTGTMTVNGIKKEDIYEKMLEYTCEEETLGSDEVGVGDFFGPTVYACVSLDKKAINYISDNHLVIKDSKKMTDDEIIELYEKHLKDNFDYQVKIVYDCELEPGQNSIEQKSFYHNKLINRYDSKKEAVIDLYTTENNFWKVSEKLQLKWNQELVLETKADGKYYTVALASIIARYHFIQEMKKLNKKYKINFPYGANVLNKAQEVANLIGKEEMAKFCKTTFKTFKEIK